MSNEPRLITDDRLRIIVTILSRVRPGDIRAIVHFITSIENCIVEKRTGNCVS